MACGEMGEAKKKREKKVSLMQLSTVQIFEPCGPCPDLYTCDPSIHTAFVNKLARPHLLAHIVAFSNFS